MPHDSHNYREHSEHGGDESYKRGKHVGTLPDGEGCNLMGYPEGVGNHRQGNLRAADAHDCMRDDELEGPRKYEGELMRPQAYDPED